MYIGAHDALVTLEVGAREGASAAAVAQALQRIERRVREQYPNVRRMYIEPMTAAPAGTAPPGFLTFLYRRPRDSSDAPGRGVSPTGRGHR